MLQTCTLYAKISNLKKHFVLLLPIVTLEEMKKKMSCLGLLSNSKKDFVLAANLKKDFVLSRPIVKLKEIFCPVMTCCHT